MTKKQNLAAKLIAECEKNLAANEYNLRKLKGIACSHSDVEIIKLYANTIMREGHYEDFLMRPRGAIAEVLGKCGLM